MHKKDGASRLFLCSEKRREKSEKLWCAAARHFFVNSGNILAALYVYTNNGRFCMADLSKIHGFPVAIC